jgi:tetratricopeptide (TPR) repeat protein
MLAKQGNLKDGIENLTKALSTDSSNKKIMIKIAESYLMTPKEDEENFNKATDYAIKYLLQVLEIEKTNYECLIGLGKAYEKKGEIDQAINFTEIAVE